MHHMEEGDSSHEASVATVPPCCAAPSPAPAPVLKRRPYSAARPPAPASVPPSAPAPPPHRTDGPPAHKHNPPQDRLMVVQQKNVCVNKPRPKS